MTRPTQQFHRGQRVKPAPRYPHKNARIFRTFGTVGKVDMWVRVKWDGLKTYERLHPDFVKPATDGVREDGTK